MDLTPGTLNGPQDIIAALPGIFGFYPQESTVIVGIYPADSDGTTRLGPVMRADLAHTHHILPALIDTPGGECIAFYAVIISRIPNSTLVEETKELLFNFSSAEGTSLIDACWHVSEIAHGTPYTIVFGPNPAHLAHVDRGEEWISGTVPCVVSSPSMKPLLHNGALPELDRADTFRFFEAWDDIDPTHPDCDPAAAARRATELALLRDTDTATLAAEIDYACAMLHELRPRPMIHEVARPGRASIFAHPGDGVDLAAMLAMRWSRDLLVIDALKSPQSAAAALLWVAKAYRGEIRANALTLWATIATARHLSSWAVVALSCAQEEVPGHSLSELLLTMLHNGLQENLVETAESGCAMAWAVFDTARATLGGE